MSNFGHTYQQGGGTAGVLDPRDDNGVDYRSVHHRRPLLIKPLVAAALLLGAVGVMYELTSPRDDYSQNYMNVSLLRSSKDAGMTPAKFERTDGRKKTPEGRPLPFAGKAMVTSEVVVKKPGARLKKYPHVWKPDEKIAPDEMRLFCTGSGNPIVRRGQAAASWVVQLGNGDNFIFDVGGGSVANIWSLGIHPSLLDKLFVTHAHLDHIGDVLVLFDGMGWGRNTPLRVWGSSGAVESEGITSILKGFRAAADWHIDSKRGLVPSTGAVFEPHEIDYSQYSAENPELLAYDENGVKIYAFPVKHCIYGAIGYRLEWNGLSATFHGDGEPNVFEAERAKGVDVMVHEGFLDAKTFSKKSHMPLQTTKSILTVHTTPFMLGRMFDIAKPNLGVGYHYFLDDDTIDPFFDGVAHSYGGPVALAQDLTVITITPDQIVTRQGETDPLLWPPPRPAGGEHPIEPKSPYIIPEFVTSTALSPEDDVEGL